MSNLKTQPTRKSVFRYLQSVENLARRRDGLTLLALFEKITGEKAVLWGNKIIGFGSYHYQYSSGRKGKWPRTGFSPGKQNMTVYIMPGFDKYRDQLERLGKHKHSVSCLYIKNLDDIDIGVLQEIIVDSVSVMRHRYP